MKKTAERYAAGLYRAAAELGCVDAVAEELPRVAEFIRLSGETLIGHMISDSEKIALLRELLAGQVSPLTLEFTVLMTSRHGVGNLPPAADEFEKLAGKAKVPVHLRVPYPLDSGILAALKSRLIAEHIIPADAAGRAEFEITVDESLLGGFIAECGGSQLDASFKSVLEKAR